MVRPPLPEGFALFCFAIYVLSGLATFLLLHIGSHIDHDDDPK